MKFVGIRTFWPLGHVLPTGAYFDFGVLGNFSPLGVFLGLGVLAHFVLKNKTRKIIITHKDFEL